MTAPDGAPVVDSSHRQALPGARAALALLVLINLFNYIDRQVLAAVVPKIETTLGLQLAADTAGAETQFSSAKIGLLQFAFLVSYMLLAPLFGLLADRVSRWPVIGFGVVLWSLASGASGWDWGLGALGAYWALFATRCFVGVGEAAYGPVAPAMISDLFPVSQRGKVLAKFYLAIPVGGALGYAWGEIVGKYLDGWLGQAGWRWAFFTVVPPGLLLGVWCLLMRDPPRGQADGVVTGQHRATLRDWPRILRVASFLYNTLGMTMMTFAIGGLAYWMPTYLEAEHVADFAGIPPGTFFGVLTASSGLLATLAGGFLGDYFRPRISGSYFLVSGLALLAGFPMVVGFVLTPFPAAWLFVFGAVFCLFFNTGPTNTILANVTHPALRASAFALNILIIHLFGDALSPFLIGLVRDATGSLKWGFALVSATMLLGGVLWLLGMKHLERDTELAPTRL